MPTVDDRSDVTECWDDRSGEFSAGRKCAFEKRIRPEESSQRAQVLQELSPDEKGLNALHSDVGVVQFGRQTDRIVVDETLENN